MSGKGPHVYCKILKYIEKNDDELFAVIDDLCLHSIFTPRRGSGITFMHPKQGSKLRQDVIDNAYSEDPEQVQKAIETVKALVVNETLENGADWAHKQPLANALGKTVPVAKATGSTVELKKDVKLKKVDLKTIPDRQNMAVWSLEGDKLELDTDPAKPKAKKGSGKTKGGQENDSRIQKTQVLETVLATPNGLARAYHEYLKEVASFLVFLKYSNDPAHNELLTGLQPLLDYDPIICYYVVFEPYCPPERRMVDSQTYNDWCGNKFYVSCRELKEIVSDASVLKDCALSSNRPAVHKAIADLRNHLLANKCNKGELPKEIESAYTQLGSQNRIGDVDNVFPAKTCELLSRSPRKKLCHDKLRYVIGFYQYDSADSNMADLVESVKSAQKADRAGFNTSTPQNFESVVIGFVRSTEFLYFSHTPEEIDVERSKSLVKPVSALSGDELKSFDEINLHAVKLDKLKSHVDSIKPPRYENSALANYVKARQRSESPQSQPQSPQSQPQSPQPQPQSAPADQLQVQSQAPEVRAHQDNMQDES